MSKRKTPFFLMSSLTDEMFSGQRFRVFAMFLFVKCVIQVDTFKGGGRASYRGGIGGQQGRQHYSRHKKGVRIQRDYHGLLPLYEL
jgi:hypothetical protein